MSDTCGKENTVCAMVECCPGFVCQSIEGNLQYHIVLSLSLSNDMHYNLSANPLNVICNIILHYHFHFLMTAIAICVPFVRRKWENCVLHFHFLIPHMEKSALPVVRQFVHNINTMTSILHDNEEDICWRMFREK